MVNIEQTKIVSGAKMVRRLYSQKTIQDYIARFDMARFLNEHLLENLQLFHFPAYSNVYIESEEQDYLYLLVEGQVQCHHYHPDGKLAVISVCSPFTALGDIEILNDEPIRSNVITTQNTTLLGIARSHVQRYGANDPCFLRFLIEQLRQKLYETNALQTNHVLPVIKRLVLYILAQATEDTQKSVVLPDKEGLASLLGTTTRHLNRVLRELVEAEYISAGYPHIYLLNRKALEDLTMAE
jgi:CRP/FNR family transcriptional regulator, putaive post-exponential-phase nitrogen-starvation regulator